ncbi:2'-5' RNA ligase family protein [Gelidibacter sp.]|uniref:2'-5' RNA ligase family protein n=1 Tax=Gelidibacter sp. TaxID=2018083 RepID=UPI002C344F73|nr:2'-5' RNA ligase family protein [Gelidibacter sp.]HUH28739.1 2'-5' RNA ligase family protein [Gelidibacter sp.]
MNKNFLIITLLAISLISSCAQKPEETLAIGVLLTVPESVYQQSIQLNRAILENHPDNITLDSQHIPHITLLHGYVLKSDLSEIKQVLDEFYKTVEPDSLWADELQYSKDKTESFASIGIKRSPPLMALHENVIALLEPYILPEGSQKAYVQNVDGTPIDEFTLAYVPKFVSAHSYDNYNPHISLGVAETALLDSLTQHHFRSIKFKAKALGIYQLGAFGTAQKRIWESE